MAVGALQIRNILEPHKMYTRDYFSIGRLKVELVNDQGEPLKKELQNSTYLINHRKTTHGESIRKVKGNQKEKVINLNNKNTKQAKCDALAFLYI